MGFSTYQPNRHFLAWPADLLNLADHLKIDNFAVVGISGGAPYALACWHQLPRSRCMGAGIVSGMYPTSFGVDGMLVANRILLWVGGWSPWLAGKALDMAMGTSAQDEAHPEKLEKLLDDSFRSRPGPDRDVWSANKNHAQLALVTSIRESFRSGGQGPGWEANLLGSDWGFTLEQTPIQPGRVVLWHGSQDVNCPMKMAEKASELMSGAELRVADGEAHFSVVVNKADEIMETFGTMFAST